MERYFECSKCPCWCETPKDFDERKHFVCCQNCLNMMYLTNGDPKDSGLIDRNKTTGYLVNQ